MIKITRFLVLILLTINSWLFAQDFSTSWKGHFSYYNIVDLTKSEDKLYAAGENSIFIYDPLTQEEVTLTTIDGLTGDNISRIYFSEIYQLLIIGYENGLIQIYNENDGDILTIVDIVDKQTIPPDKKKINHFNEFNEFIYIASDFGISVYNLEQLEFDDTYFIGDGGAQIGVEQTSIDQGFIYAACQDNNGLKKALITSENLINFQEWETFSPGNFRAINSVLGNLYALRNDNRVFKILDTGINEILAYAQIPRDFRNIKNEIVVTLTGRVDIYDNNFLVQIEISKNDFDTIDSDTSFITTEIIGDNIYIATNNSGVLVFNRNDLITFNTLIPSGPFLNNAFSIEALPNGVWVSYGEYSRTFNPGVFNRRGISNLDGEEWVNISRDSIFGAIDLNTISINPFNSSQVFISSFQSGILEVNDNVPTILYDESNSGLESLINPNNPNFKSIRTSASTFDRDGVLWSLTGRIQSPLKSYDPNTSNWESFDFGEVISNPLTSELGYGAITIDNSGNKWIGGLRLGFIGFRQSDGLVKNIISEEQNLPDTAINAVAVDDRNQVWIGTAKGLRVLFNPDGFFEEDTPILNSIIIEEDGLAQELLFQQFIRDIEVDGSNNKWIATADVGVFYLSEDGQEAIFHFTKDNSPIPSNNVVDISIDDTNGTVYIATTSGLVSFQSGSSKPVESLNTAFVFPNPVRPGFNAVDDKIKIKDISENVNIKITDIEGNLVAEAQSNTNQRNQGYNLEIDGGTAFWNGKNLSGRKVSSGVYLIMLTDLDSIETKVLKLMVVR